MAKPEEKADASTIKAKFSVGQIIHHQIFDYRGVIVDVDPGFMGSQDWYRQMAKTNPPRNRPWYHVLVDEFDRRPTSPNATRRPTRTTLRSVIPT